MFSFITRRDHSLMHRANNWVSPRWVRIYVGGATRFEALAAAIVASALSALLFMWLKRFTGRRRPCQIEPHCWATLLPPDHFSFPSGHTMMAFAVAVSLSLFYPALTIGLLFCALSIAMSRILLGMHFLSDVVVGALIGTGLGY